MTKITKLRQRQTKIHARMQFNCRHDSIFQNNANKSQAQNPGSLNQRSHTVLYVWVERDFAEGADKPRLKVF